MSERRLCVVCLKRLPAAGDADCGCDDRDGHECERCEATCWAEINPGGVHRGDVASVAALRARLAAASAQVATLTRERDEVAAALGAKPGDHPPTLAANIRKQRDDACASEAKLAQQLATAHAAGREAGLREAAGACETHVAVMRANAVKAWQDAQDAHDINMYADGAVGAAKKIRALLPAAPDPRGESSRIVDGEHGNGCRDLMCYGRVDVDPDEAKGVGHV